MGVNHWLFDTKIDGKVGARNSVTSTLVNWDRNKEVQIESKERNTR